MNKTAGLLLFALLLSMFGLIEAVDMKKCNKCRDLIDKTFGNSKVQEAVAKSKEHGCAAGAAIFGGVCAAIVTEELPIIGDLGCIGGALAFDITCHKYRIKDGGIDTTKMKQQHCKKHGCP